MSASHIDPDDHPLGQPLGRTDVIGARAGFSQASAVADAVLYEGYALYPYRGSAVKNQSRVRWQFGVLTPRAWVEPRGSVVDGVAGSTEWWWQQTECLLEAPASAMLGVRVRHLQLQRRWVEDRAADGAFHATPRLQVDGRTEVPFDEAVPVEHDLALVVDDLLGAGRTQLFTVPGARETTPVTDERGDEVGRVVRERTPLELTVQVSLTPAPAPFPLHRLRVRIENSGDGVDPGLPRDQALRHSPLSTHCLLGIDRGGFLSQVDPPEWAATATGECHNVRTFPVLAGAPSERDLVLSAPIILYDHPEVAPESPGDLHDAAEIDEILSLRTQTLTEEEKREARATDPRVADLLDRVDDMPPEVMDRLHGAVRSPCASRPGRTNETVLVDGVRVAPGSQVRLRPRRRGTDAHDMFLAGRTARVDRVLTDVDDATHLAVTIEDDPSAELHQWYGRFHYYGVEEVEPL